MKAALRYEWVRIRTIRSTWWLCGIALVLGIGLSLLMAIGTSAAFAGPSRPPAGDLAMLAPGVTTQFAAWGAPYLVGYVLAMLGVLAWGHEYRHGMIRATLTALSSRTSAWVAKFVVVGGWVLSVAALTLLGSAFVGWLWLRDNGVDFATPAIAGTIGRTLLYTLLLAWAATAFTALLRNQTAALVLLFLWPLVVESVVTLLPNVVPGLQDAADLTRFLPFNAGARILNGMERADSAFGVPLSAVGGAVVFGGTTLALMVLSLAFFRRRDA